MAEKSLVTYIWFARETTVDVSQEGERVMGWKGMMSRMSEHWALRSTLRTSSCSGGLLLATAAFNTQAAAWVAKSFPDEQLVARAALAANWRGAVLG